MIIEYLDDKEPLTLQDVKAQCSVGFAEDDAYFTGVVIPAARALAEEVSGSAIRPARYTEQFETASAMVLGKGCVQAVESVLVDGEPVAFTTTQRGCSTVVHAPTAQGKPAQVTYTAGINITNHPGVRAWMLLAAAWLYANRELIAERDGPKEPPHIAKSLLSSINVHPGF